METLSKEWQKFLSLNYPEKSKKETTQYFGIKDTKYFPKIKFKKELENIFLKRNLK